MIAHKITPDAAAVWGIEIIKDGLPVDFIEIDPDAGTALIAPDTEVKLVDYEVHGLERYRLIIGF